MSRIEKVEAYNTDDLLKKLEEINKSAKRPYRLVTITYGLDNTPVHTIEQNIYTAWLELE